MYKCRTQRPRGIRRGSAAARLWVWIPPKAWISVSWECCVLSSRGLCVKLITRSDKSYRIWGVVVCDPRTSRPRPTFGRSATEKKIRYYLRESGCGSCKFSYSQMSTCKTTKTCTDLDLKSVSKLEIKKSPAEKTKLPNCGSCPAVPNWSTESYSNFFSKHRSFITSWCNLYNWAT